MRNHFNSGIKYLISTTAASLLLTGSALAIDAATVAERIKSAYAKQGGEISYESVEGDASAIKFRSVEIATTTDPDTKFEIGDVTLKNISENANGSYLIGELTIPNLSLDLNTEDTDKEAGTLVIEGITSEGFTIPAENAKSALDKMIFYDKAHIKKLEISGADDVNMLMEDINASFSNKDGKEINFSWGVGNLVIDMKDTPADETIPDLGIDKFEATITSKGQWQPESGIANLEQLDIDVKNIGKLGITTEIGGYDLAFVDAVQKAQDEIIKAGADDAASGLAILGLAEQLTIKGASIRFDDQSLTNKLFDYYAKENNTDANTLREQAKLIVPLMVSMQLNNPQFSESVKIAADKYFSDPKSFTLKALPAQAVSIASIVATASIDPTKLLDLLKVTLTAND